MRFTGTAYEVALTAYQADFRAFDRALEVRVLEADRAGYAPGDRATIAAFRVLDATGHPVRASVFVRAIDEKLLAIGGASYADPVSELYQGAH